MSRLREEDDPYVVEEPSDEERALSRCLELPAGGGLGPEAAGPGPRPACAGPGAQRCRQCRALSAGALAWRWVSAPAARGAQEDRPNISRDDFLETGVFLFLISQLPAPSESCRGIVAGRTQPAEAPLRLNQSSNTPKLIKCFNVYIPRKHRSMCFPVHPIQFRCSFFKCLCPRFSYL